MAAVSVIGVTAGKVSAHALERAAELLADGHAIVAPTETRYGLLARADRPEAIERLFKLKERGTDKPTALFVRDPGTLSDFGVMTPLARKLAEAFLPGPLTLVLKTTKNWKPPLVVDGKIGLRCSSCHLIEQLLDRVDFPLTATSANKSGRNQDGSVEEIMTQFGDQVQLYLDGGRLEGASSTVVDCSGESVRILREGALPTKAILETAGVTGG